MLRVDRMPLGLSGVRAEAAKEETRPKLERFQLGAAKVLWEAFQQGRLTTAPALDDLLRSPFLSGHNSDVITFQSLRRFSEGSSRQRHQQEHQDHGFNR